jgi:hypothetical protein
MELHNRSFQSNGSVYFLTNPKEEWRKADWGKGLFDLPPDDRHEFIPAP